MKRYLVTIDIDGPQPELLAGIYVYAETAADAKKQVRALLREGITLQAYAR